MGGRTRKSFLISSGATTFRIDRLERNGLVKGHGGGRDDVLPRRARWRERISGGILSVGEDEAHMIEFPEGNDAVVPAEVDADCRFFAGYLITPA